MVSEKVNDIYEILILMTSYFLIQLGTWYPSKNELESKTTGTFLKHYDFLMIPNY